MMRVLFFIAALFFSSAHANDSDFEALQNAMDAQQPTLSKGRAEEEFASERQRLEKEKKVFDAIFTGPAPNGRSMPGRVLEESARPLPLEKLGPLDQKRQQQLEAIRAQRPPTQKDLLTAYQRAEQHYQELKIKYNKLMRKTSGPYAIYVSEDIDERKKLKSQLEDAERLRFARAQELLRTSVSDFNFGEHIALEEKQNTPGHQTNEIFAKAQEGEFLCERNFNMSPLCVKFRRAYQQSRVQLRKSLRNYEKAHKKFRQAGEEKYLQRKIEAAQKIKEAGLGLTKASNILRKAINTGELNAEEIERAKNSSLLIEGMQAHLKIQIDSIDNGWPTNNEAFEEMLRQNYSRSIHDQKMLSDLGLQARHAIRASNSDAGVAKSKASSNTDGQNKKNLRVYR